MGLLKSIPSEVTNVVEHTVPFCMEEKDGIYLSESVLAPRPPPRPISPKLEHINELLRLSDKAKRM